MKTNRLFVLCLLLLTCSISRTGFGADIEQIIHDTQRMSHHPDRIDLVWWVPSVFWEETFKSESHMSQEQKQEFVKTVDDYTVFILVSSEIGAMAAVTPRSKEELLKNTEFKVHGEVIKPVPDEKLSPAAKNLFAMMKPVMANMLGQFGQGIEFIAYPNKKNGKKVIDPKTAGEFDYKLYDETFHWRLPLGSLLPPKMDEKTKETFPGNYLYNPYTGSKLVDKQAAQE